MHKVTHSRKRKFAVATLLKKERKTSERTIIKKERRSYERSGKIIRMRTTTKSMRTGVRCERVLDLFGVT
jgi:hypothetical protein